MKNNESIKRHGDVIWNIANLLRGPYRPPQYRRVMIPLTVLRRLDCEGRIDLSHGDGHPLKSPGDVGTGQKDQTIRLSELIDLLTERFGTGFTQADQLFFDQIQEEALESDALRKAAATNSKVDFRYVFERAFEGLVIDRMDGNEEISGKLMSDGEFRKLVVEHLLHKVYAELTKARGAQGQ